jgi:hypothetical protein
MFSKNVPDICNISCCMLFQFQIKALSSLARLQLLNVLLTLSLSRRESFYPLPSGEGGQRPDEGLLRLNPRRLDFILDLELVLFKSELLQILV